jgi:hypothetical protein
MTQEEKQAAEAARWLNDQGWTVELQRGQYQWSITRDRIEYWSMTDAELIKEAEERGMELPAELIGWIPIDQIPEEWRDGRDVLLMPFGKFVNRRVLIWDKHSECWLCPHSRLGWPDKAFTHAMLPPEPPKETTE